MGVPCYLNSIFDLDSAESLPLAGAVFTVLHVVKGVTMAGHRAGGRA